MNTKRPNITPIQQQNIQKIVERLQDLLNNNPDNAGPEGLILLGQAVLLDKFTQPLSNPFSDVRDFHTKMGIPSYTGGLPHAFQYFRDGILEEEYNEYCRAVKKCDREEQFDALLDLIYVACGTIAAQSWNGEEGWKRVHTANMKKYPGQPGEGKAIAKRTNQVDILKPKGWQPPYLGDLI